MKLTGKRLKKLIKEEVRKFLVEQDGDTAAEVAVEVINRVGDPSLGLEVDSQRDDKARISTNGRVFFDLYIDPSQGDERFKMSATEIDSKFRDPRDEDVMDMYSAVDRTTAVTSSISDLVGFVKDFSDYIEYTADATWSTPDRTPTRPDMIDDEPWGDAQRSKRSGGRSDDDYMSDYGDW